MEPLRGPKYYKTLEDALYDPESIITLTANQALNPKYGPGYVHMQLSAEHPSTKGYTVFSTRYVYVDDMVDTSDLLTPIPGFSIWEFLHRGVEANAFDTYLEEQQQSCSELRSTFDNIISLLDRLMSDDN